MTITGDRLRPRTRGVAREKVRRGETLAGRCLEVDHVGLEWLARQSSADRGCDQCRFAGLQLSRERWTQRRPFKAVLARFSRCPLFGPLGDLAFADCGGDVVEVEQRDAEVFVRRDEVGRRRRAALP